MDWNKILITIVFLFMMLTFVILFLSIKMYYELDGKSTHHEKQRTTTYKSAPWQEEGNVEELYKKYGL